MVSGLFVKVMIVLSDNCIVYYVPCFM